MVDLYGYLLRNRVVFLNQRISDTVAIQVVASLLALDSLDSTAEIKLYINCPQVGVRRYNRWYISA
jgi:ATP-dependent Clp protease protease subunit